MQEITELDEAINRILFFEKTYGSPPGTSCYGLGDSLKKYVGIPKFIPINLEIDHGIPISNEVNQCQLKTKLPILVTRKEQQDLLQKYSIKSYIMGSPFVHYKKLNNIKVQPNSGGTILFPVHSTHLIDVVFDWQKYAEDLLDLPSKFYPLTICMYWKDLIQNRHRPFVEKNISVVTAGHMADPDFMKNFYQLLKKHSYSSSNAISSCTFYSIEMGIPFFLYGQSPHFNNHGGDHNRPNGLYDFKDIGYDKSKFFELFDFGSIENIQITEEIKEICNKKLGLNDHIDKNELKRILLVSSFKYLFLEKPMLMARKAKHILYGVLSKLAKRNHQALRKIQSHIYILFNGLSKENRIFTHLTLEEKVLIHKIIRHYIFHSEQTEINCVEIGSFLGGSACFIANAITENSRLYCIDTWGNQAMIYCEADTEKERDTYPEFKINTQKYSNKIITLRKWSSNAIIDLVGKGIIIDFLFIDGDHSYESVNKDWQLYSPLLHINSVVAFHDTGWADGVNKVIAESVISRTEQIAELPNIKFFRIIK